MRAAFFHPQSRLEARRYYRIRSRERGLVWAEDKGTAAKWEGAWQGW